MKVLMLSNYMICPPISGGAKRFLAPVINLKKNIKYSIIYMAYAKELIHKNNIYLNELENVDYVEGVLTDEVFMWSGANLPPGIPAEVWGTMNRDYLAAVLRHLTTHTYDIIQVEHSQLAWIVPKIRRICPNTKIVLDYHNMEWLVFERWLPYETDAGQKKYLETEYKNLKSWEESVFSWFDAIFCISPVEKNIIEKYTSTPVYYVPSGAGINDDEYFPPENSEKKYDLFFIGSMNWYPNVQALEWFITKVLPIIQKKYPNVKLDLAGSGAPNPQMLKYIKSNKNITFWGEVNDERPFLHESKVFISPIWIGAGVRLKNPTAWAAKIPVVATTLSVEGLEYTKDYDILIGDTPQEFADKVISILENSSYGEKIAENGYKTYKEQYSIERMMHMWELGYKSVLEEDK